MRLTNILYLFIIYVSSLSVVSCSTNVKNEEDRIITVSIEPLRYFTESVVGDKFKVVSMVPNGNSPETYEPSPEQMAGLASSTIYISVGNLGFENTWLDRFRKLNPDMKVVNSSSGIYMLNSANGIPDPHVWMGCGNAMKMIDNICKAVCETDTSNCRYYMSRADSIKKQILMLKKSLSTKIVGKGAFIIYHPSLTYFAEEFHLKQIPMEEEGREPGARQIARVIDYARKLGVRKMLIQKEFSNSNIEPMVKTLGISTGVINPLSYDWMGEMANTAKAFE